MTSQVRTGLLEELLNLVNTGSVDSKALRVLGELGVWRDAPDEYVLRVVLSRIPVLVESVLQTVQGQQHGLPLFDVKPLDWWLDWLTELTTEQERFFSSFLIGGFLARGDASTRNRLLAEFNKAIEPSYRLLGQLVLSKLEGLTTDDLSSAVLDRLLLELDRPLVSVLGAEPLLGILATEAFVRRELLPRLRRHGLNEASRRGLTQSLLVAGRRHNKRYVFANEMPR